MKTRLDFISNSSSCSYIISSNDPPIAFVNKIGSCGENSDNTIEMPGEEYDYIQNYVALTLMDILYTDRKEFCAEVCGNLSIPKEEIPDYFTESGEVRDDLDVKEIIKRFTYFDWTYPQYHEEWTNYQNLAQVNEYSIKFSKWIFEKVSELYTVSKFTKENYLPFINDVEDQLKERNVYLLWATYSGNGYESGKMYISLDSKYKYVKNVLDASNAVHKLLRQPQPPTK